MKKSNFVIKLLVLIIILWSANASALEVSYVKKGDTFLGVLSPVFTSEEIIAMAKSLKSKRPSFVLMPGMEVQSDVGVVSIAAANDLEIIFSHENGNAVVNVVKHEYVTLTTIIQGEIKSSLYQSILDIKEDPELASSLARIYEWEFDFFRDFRKGDTYKVLIEKRFVRNKFVGYGKILAAEFIVKGKTHKAYRYTNKGKSGYFTETGRPLERGFLRVPLEYSRISSVFTDSRLHPVTKKAKPHYGVDYAAPTGTPVMVTATGVITKITYNKASGNFIEVTHANGYQTYYLHLSRFQGGLKRGSNVAQGQTIGYVGSTGLSTGPHLDYRIKKGNKWLNPQNFIAEVPKLNVEAQVALKSIINEFDRYLYADMRQGFAKRELLETI